jgi:hypothetical protein
MEIGRREAVGVRRTDAVAALCPARRVLVTRAAFF